MTFSTAADVLTKFADYPPERVRLRPVPGTATKQDVIEIECTEGKFCELIDGVLVEKTVGFKESFVATEIIRLLGPFVKAHDPGLVAGADGTVESFPGQVRIPEVAFYAWSKLPSRRIPEGPIPGIVPDLAAEVLSASNTRGEMVAQLKDYFFAGVRLVWYVDPAGRAVDVYTGPESVTRRGEADTLTGGDVLPGLAVPVAELFGGAYR